MKDYFVLTKRDAEHERSKKGYLEEGRMIFDKVALSSIDNIVALAENDPDIILGTEDALVGHALNVTTLVFGLPLEQQQIVSPQYTGRFIIAGFFPSKYHTCCLGETDPAPSHDVFAVMSPKEARDKYRKLHLEGAQKLYVGREVNVQELYRSKELTRQQQELSINQRVHAFYQAQPDEQKQMLIELLRGKP